MSLPEDLSTYGNVAVEQVRAFGPEARNPHRIEALAPDGEFMRKATECLRSFF